MLLLSVDRGRNTAADRVVSRLSLDIVSRLRCHAFRYTHGRGCHSQPIRDSGGVIIIKTIQISLQSWRHRENENIPKGRNTKW